MQNELSPPRVVSAINEFREAVMLDNVNEARVRKATPRLVHIRCSNELAHLGSYQEKWETVERDSETFDIDSEIRSS
jgi:hypothetical protein